MTNNVTTAKEYFLQQQMLCNKYLLAFARKNNAEDLHQLRVSIKKIRAVLTMLNHLQHKFSFNKHYAPYKKIFKHLGPIREAALQNNRLKKEAGHTPAKSSRTLIITFRKEFKQLIPTFSDSIKAATPVITRHLDKLNHRDIFPYCRELLKHIRHHWGAIKTDEDLHKFRKQLKQLLYCSNLLTPKEKAKILSSKQHKRLDELQDLIGTWHDNTLLLGQIKKKRLEVNPRFLLSLQQETKTTKGKISRKGNKL